MEYDIFISYSRVDTPIVDQFVDKLTEAGYRVWIDRERVLGGDLFAAKLEEGIEKSSLFVFFSSKNSNRSKWIVKEISHAFSLGRVIIPIKIDDHDDFGIAINFYLSGIDFIQYHPNRLTSATEHLIKSISERLGNPQPCSASIDPYAGLTPDELFSCGVSYYDKKEYVQAVKLFHKAAKRGHIEAQFKLGICYRRGWGVTQDYDKAVKWYREAAERGHADAQNSLGTRYKKGQGVLKNLDKAQEWYLKAAEQGNAIAQKNLGICFMDNLDYDNAFGWFQKAADQGDVEAQEALGVFYEHGHGHSVPKDLNKAIKWYRKAAQHGNKYAIKNLKRLGEWHE